MQATLENPTGIEPVIHTADILTLGLLDRELMAAIRSYQADPSPKNTAAWQKAQDRMASYLVTAGLAAETVVVGHRVYRAYVAGNDFDEPGPMLSVEFAAIVNEITF